VGAGAEGQAGVSALRAVLRWVGVAGVLIIGVWGFILSLRIILDAAGFWGGLVAFILFPITFAFVPWYAGVALHDWTLLLVNYGGGFLCSVLYVLGKDD
jgi:hypothetical protein